MDEITSRLITDALTLLDDIDCECEETGLCSIDHPICHAMRIRAAKAKLNDTFNAVVTTRTPDRLHHMAERIYFEAAQSLGESRLHGDSMLSTILEDAVTHRDAQVIGTFIQWLGTNCGLSFIRSCEDKITTEKAFRHAWDQHRQGWNPPSSMDSPRWLSLTAEMLLQDIPTTIKSRNAARNRLMRFFNHVLVIIAYLSGMVDGQRAAALLGITAECFDTMLQDAIDKARVVTASTDIDGQ